MARNTTCCTWQALDVLHVICIRLRPGHLSVHVGDSSRRSEEIVEKSRIVPFNAIIIIIINQSEWNVIQVWSSSNWMSSYYFWVTGMQDIRDVLEFWHAAFWVFAGSWIETSCFETYINFVWVIWACLEPSVTCSLSLITLSWFNDVLLSQTKCLLKRIREILTWNYVCWVLNTT